MFNEYPDIMTVSEMQKALSIGRNTAYGLLKSGVIKYLDVGKKNFRIPKKCLIDYILDSCYNDSCNELTAVNKKGVK
jgi:excisionase family DNA binding protein